MAAYRLEMKEAMGFAGSAYNYYTISGPGTDALLFKDITHFHKFDKNHMQQIVDALNIAWDEGMKQHARIENVSRPL